MNQMSQEELNHNLLAANQACVERTIPLVQMLGRCRQQFRLYAESHRAKNTEDGNQKATVNDDFAKDIDEILRNFRERETTNQE